MEYGLLFGTSENYGSKWNLRTGARRKKRASTVSEKGQNRFTVNCSTTARNLRKSDLSGVIFGCKHSTYGECLSKQLFGLPAPHYSYVKNIKPGLPLFLFNYSDRKLHGIFEAASSGQLAINSTAWTTDGSENTPYAAQVKIHIQMECQPLLEDQFKPIIVDNYYEPKLFWFELDHAQTKKLISMFSSSPIVTHTALSKKTEKMGAQLKAVAPNAKQECDTGERSAFKFGVSNMNPASIGGSTLDPSIGHSYSSVVRNVTDADTTQTNVGWFISENPNSREERQPFSCSINNEVTRNHNLGAMYQNLNCNISQLSVVRYPQKKWSALFKEGTCSEVTNEVEEFNPPASGVNLVHLNMPNGESESPFLLDCSDESGEVAKAPLGIVDSGACREVANLEPNCEAIHSPLVTEPSTFYLQNCSFENLPIAGAKQDSKYFQLAASEVNLPFPDKFCKEWSSSYMSLGLEEEKHHLEVPAEENQWELPGEDMLFKSDRECSSCSFASRDIESTDNQVEDAKIQSTNPSFPVVELSSEMNSSSINSTLAKLLFEVRELRLSQFQQIEKVNSLEQKLVETRLEIQQLKGQCRILETDSVSKCEEEELQSEDERPCAACDSSICIVGGFDGSSWLSSLDIYSFSQDQMRTCTSMSFLRSYASAAKFSGELYLLGGVDGNFWYDTVESYNPVSNQWTSHPSLTQNKGSFSVLSLEHSMFAFGGGNGVECFSQVEMFDPNVGIWIPIQSLLQKRFAPAAAEVHGIFYVSGGYDGNNYLKSIERLDPRARSWEKLEGMPTKRGCHALVLLNEKLYAIGGFDGTRMVSAVEVFDPRAGSWMMESSMNNSRGYFGTVVIRDEIHVIGGLLDDEEVLDKVESYKDGQGWQVRNWKAIGKRCFFSAILL